MITVALATLALLQEKPPFYNDVQAFLQKDRQNPPARNQVLFIGSSSFTIWTHAQEAFPTHKILNRAFGGSTLPDVTRYADQIVFPYHPKQVVIYCGENDLAAPGNIPAYVVYNRFTKLFHLIRNRMPKVPIVYVSMKPSPSREHLFPKMIAANGWIKEFLGRERDAKFVDVFPLMLTPQGKPRPELFGPDMLHMNADGYAIWTKALEPYLL